MQKHIFPTNASKSTTNNQNGIKLKQIRSKICTNSTYNNLNSKNRPKTCLEPLLVSVLEENTCFGRPSHLFVEFLICFFIFYFWLSLHYDTNSDPCTCLSGRLVLFAVYHQFANFLEQSSLYSSWSEAFCVCTETYTNTHI